MPSIHGQCDRDLLQQSLDDVLTEDQEESLAAHLNDCSDCQDWLNGFAQGQVDWQRVKRVLSDETTGAGGRSELVSTLVPRDLSSIPGTSLEFDSARAASDFAVNFLEPTDSDESLGKLRDIEIRSVIGSGGNGIVLKGFQLELNRLVAVKVMAPHLAASGPARQRFAREAQATAAIVHPNVMPILAVDSSGQLPYLLMPYVDCESLQERLDRAGSLPVIDVLRIGLQIASGLAAAHAQGLVHRDVKPANILMERSVDRVMLTDFGLARAVDDATLTRTGLIAGTPQYMSPEQARGDSVDTRSDLFSLGSVLYAMCTGRAPFRAETTYGILRRVTDDAPRSMRDFNSDVPDWLDAFTLKLLSKQPSDRWQTADQIAQILEDCVAHVQQPATQPLPDIPMMQATRDRQPRWRNTPAMSVVGAATAVVLCLAALMLWPDQMRHDVSADESPGTTFESGHESPAIAGDTTSSTAMSEAENSLDTGQPDVNDAWEIGVLNELEMLRNDAEFLKEFSTEDWSAEDLTSAELHPDDITE